MEAVDPPAASPRPRVSVIVPALNESASIMPTLKAILRLPGSPEVIVVDGGSDDGTAAIAASAGAKVIQAPRGRGSQLHAGARVARGEILWFVHADTLVTEDSIDAIVTALDSRKVVGGNFSIRFDGDFIAARFLTWLYRHLAWLGLRYGDSTYFVRRDAYERSGGFRPLPIFEDLDLLRRLRRQGVFVRAEATVTTSSRRFQNRSFVLTFAHWTLLQALYWLGASPNCLGRIYRHIRFPGKAHREREINGMVVVVTGASAGIGRALARELSKRGALLVLAARRLSRLQQLNDELGGMHLCLEIDVADRQQCRRLISATINHFGRIGTLVCNAGFGLIRPVDELRADELLQLLSTNVVGTIECIRHAIPQMRNQDVQHGWRGQIVVVTSAAARRGLPEFGAYTASKAAQLSLTEALRVELMPEQIAVTSVQPCGTDTEFFRAAIRHSGRLPPRRNAIELHQSAEQVAMSIANVIARPRPEVWPLRRFRLLMSLATFFPSITDRIVLRRVRAVGTSASTRPQRDDQGSTPVPIASASVHSVGSRTACRAMSIKRESFW